MDDKKRDESFDEIRAVDERKDKQEIKKKNAWAKFWRVFYSLGGNLTFLP